MKNTTQVWVSAQLMELMLRQCSHHHTTVTKGLPFDADIVGVKWDETLRQIVLEVESDAVLPFPFTPEMESLNCAHPQNMGRLEVESDAVLPFPFTPEMESLNCAHPQNMGRLRCNWCGTENPP